MDPEFPIVLVIVLLGLSSLLIGLLNAYQSLKQKMAATQLKLEGDIDQLTRSRSQTQTTQATLAQQNRNLTAALNRQTQELAQAKQDLETVRQPLELQLTAQALHIQTLAQTNVQQESALKQSRETQVLLTEQLSDLTRLKVCIEDELQNRQQWGETLEKEVLLLRQTNTNLQTEGQRIKDNAVLLQTKIDWLTQTKVQQEEDLRQAFQSIESLKHQVQELNKAKGMLERDLQREMEQALALELKLKALQQLPQNELKDAKQPDPTHLSKDASPTEQARGPMLPQFAPLSSIHRSLTQPLNQ